MARHRTGSCRVTGSRGLTPRAGERAVRRSCAASVATPAQKPGSTGGTRASQVMAIQKFLKERAMGLEPTTSSLGRRPVYGLDARNRTVLERVTSTTPRCRTLNPDRKTDLVDPWWTRPAVQCWIVATSQMTTSLSTTDTVVKQSVRNASGRTTTGTRPRATNRCPTPGQPRLSIRLERVAVEAASRQRFSRRSVRRCDPSSCSIASAHPHPRIPSAEQGSSSSYAGLPSLIASREPRYSL